MNDRPTPTPDSPNVYLPPRDPARHSSHRPLRPHDSMGALDPVQARLDEANATGYARGLAEARDEALDDLRTILSTIIESRFVELTESAFDSIAEADVAMLKKWIVTASVARDLDGLFAPEG